MPQDTCITNNNEERGDDDDDLLLRIETESLLVGSSDQDDDFNRKKNESGKSRTNKKKLHLFLSVTLNVILLLALLCWHYLVGSSGDHSTRAISGRGGDDGHDVVVVYKYGHVHVAKTAGTEVNGELASHFERVCGHKGYSYDAYQFNERVQNHNTKNGGGRVSDDLISNQYKGHNRGRVPLEVMQEIGFDDCDYISLEAPWESWLQLNKEWSLELHVPCRDPLDHLLSECNFRHVDFNCHAENLQDEISKCLFATKRFSRELTDGPNIHLKCFTPIPLEPYLDYMGERLQRKRMESLYVHRDTNQPRDKAHEYIWWNTQKDVATQVRAILLEKYDYYQWCDECLGSKNDLVLSNNSTR
jgi:hypothetical protein